MKTLSKKCFPLGMRIVIKALLPVLSVALLVGASGSAAAESSGAETDLPLPV